MVKDLNMNYAVILKFFFMTFLIGMVLSHPASEVGTVKEVKFDSEITTTDGYYDMLALPYILFDDPLIAAATNVTHLIELKKQDPNAKLPTLPEHIVEKYKVKPKAATQAKDVLLCQTSQASPPSVWVEKNGNYLLSIGKPWCCSNQKFQACTRMAISGKAGTDICAMQGICVRCSWAGNANKQIANLCEDLNFRSGGYMRRYVDDIFKPYFLDVNAYTV
ncbi:hypothetical protein BDD12DRAFT_874202 [Trichophaea hybrida]|nr:hypothetical protein BDD12DRAFT_874202 [Trichophaea hybrida]